VPEDISGFQPETKIKILITTKEGLKKEYQQFEEELSTIDANVSHRYASTAHFKIFCF
jgi:hypothetical protein